MAIGDLTRVNTNLQSMQSLSTLQRTNEQLGVRQMRLATGSRLNRAEDDSASYAIARKLESRVRGQAQALSNIGDAKSMLTVAEGGLSSVMDILQSMKEKAVQAANDSLGSDERTKISNELSALRSEITDIFGETTYNGKSLFSGSGATSFDFQVGADSTDSFAVSINAISTSTLSLESGSDAANVTLNSGFGNGATVANVGVNLNSYTGDTQEVTFSVDSISGATVTLRYGLESGDTVSFTASTTGGSFAFAGATISLTTANASNGASDFLDAGDSFSVEFVKAGLDVASATTARSTISTIDSAIDTVATRMSDLGNSQKRLSFKQDSVQTSMTNYEAARSRIEDADFAKEQMEIVKLQILQQTGISSMAQANAAPQGVLSLLG